ncbi:MAG: hypothetical protein AAGK02_10250 [Pseudomonadota bacterium]
MYELSALSALAAAFYLVVACTCLWASRSSAIHRQLSRHIWIWAGIAAFFVALVAMRLLSVEEVMRDELRDFLRSRNGYGARREMQGPIAAGIMILSGVLALIGLRFALLGEKGRRGRAVVVALAASVAMAVLVILRIVSFHALDVILRGPLKLNWIGDIGASAIVLACAIYYVKLMGSKTSSSRRR